MTHKANNVAEMAKLALAALQELYPLPETALRYSSAWELLVATVLAAQCTDARVNTITPHFFRRWPGPAELRRADIAEVEDVIHSAGFFHNKAKNLLACAAMVQDKYGGELPRNIDALARLPGVARKTANCILFGAWGINEGIAVDTHVRRVSHRLGLTRNTDPRRIEQDLMRLFPQDEWGALNQRMVYFGRQICMARKPSCVECRLEQVCPRLEPPRPATGRKEQT